MATAPKTLTLAQLTVLRLAAKGLHNKQIAHELSCSPYTVKYHLSAAYAVLDVPHRTAATLALWRLGLMGEQHNA